MNEKTLNAMNNCSALFLRWNVDGRMCYSAAKQFVDEYEREQHEQLHQSQAVPVNWSIEKDNAYHSLTEAIFNRATLLTIHKAAKHFADICEREEHEMPKVGDIYRDVFGQRLVVTGIFSIDYGNRKTVVFHNKETERSLSLEEFIRCFQKV